MKQAIAGALKNNQLIKKSDKEKFTEFLNRGKNPYDYERLLLQYYFERVVSILKNENPPPYEIEIQAASKCNANCNHCWARDFSKLEDKLNKKENIDRIIEQILNFKKNGFEIRRVKFCGSTGEPLLNEQTLYAINKLYGKKYLRLFTNGIKLGENKNKIPYLKTLSKIDNLILSLDAGSTKILHKIKPGSRHISLEDILEAVMKIKYLSDKGINIEVSYVITNENYLDIINAVEKSKNIAKADKIRFRIDLTDRSVSKNHSALIIKQLNWIKSYGDKNFKVIPIHSEEEIKQEEYGYFTSKDSGFKCFTSKLWACIGANGCLYPCGHIVSGDTKNYGSILENSIEKIWESKERACLTNNLPIEKCTICSPFSLRINRFLTFLSNFSLEKIYELYQENF